MTHWWLGLEFRRRACLELPCSKLAGWHYQGYADRRCRFGRSDICSVSAYNALPTRTGPGQHPSPSRPSESLIIRPDRE